MNRTSPSRSRPVVQSRLWFVRSYLRGLAGLAITMIALVVALRPVNWGTGEDLARVTPTLSPEERHERMMAYFESVGVDLLAPIHEQFIDVVATRLLHPIVLVPFLLAAVGTIYFTWRSRS